jgi:hypothetical protein
MSHKRNIGTHFYWMGNTCEIIQQEEGVGRYTVQYSPLGLHCSLTDEQLDKIEAANHTDVDAITFTPRTPHFVVVDNFYKDPMSIVNLAKSQVFNPSPKHYKGLRSPRILLPGMKEEFERLLGVKISDWLHQPVNGVFQVTKFSDPLVWHSDSQNYAAAIYLTPGAPIGAGTSFWRDRKHGCRRPATHPMEMRGGDADTLVGINNEVYTEYNITHPDNWELVDKVGAVFNRLVIWDAQLIHSASSYEGFTDDSNSRLVQLFFFTVEN